MNEPQPVHGDPNDPNDPTIRGALTSDELQDRELTVASAIEDGAAIHPGDAGEGQVSAVSLDAFTGGMIQDSADKRLLKDPQARVAVGSSEDGASALENVHDQNDASAAVGARPGSRPGRPSPPVARRPGQAARRPAQPAPPTRGEDGVRPGSQLPRNPPSMNGSQSTVEHLLWENARLRGIILHLEERSGLRLSERDPKLGDKVLEYLPSEDDLVKRLIQIVMVQLESGKKSFTVVVNEKPMAVSHFRAEVDAAAGKFDFKVTMEKDLFDEGNPDS